MGLLEDLVRGGRSRRNAVKEIKQDVKEAVDKLDDKIDDVKEDARRGVVKAAKAIEKATPEINDPLPSK
jgi:phage shock protein A